MTKFQDILKGGDLRSIGNSNKVVALVKTQDDFDQLFVGLQDPDRTVVMRTADAIEKITVHKPGYLQKHKAELLKHCKSAEDIEVKWHLALLVSRLELTQKEFEKTWDILSKWATDRNESKIVRVNSVQGLFNMMRERQEMYKEFNLVVQKILRENIPSLNARIRKIKNDTRKKL